MRTIRLKKGVECFSNVFLVLKKIAQEHKDIIQVNYDCDIKVRPVYPIDEGLKAGGSVYWPEWHHQVFK